MLEMIIYIIFSSSGLTLIKLGLMNKSELFINKAGLFLSINWILLLGMVFFVSSFFISFLVIKKMNLSFYYPVSAGAIYILVCLSGVLFFKDEISLLQIIGILMILIGIVIVNIAHFLKP